MSGSYWIEEIKKNTRNSKEKRDGFLGFSRKREEEKRKRKRKGNKKNIKKKEKGFVALNNWV